MSHYQMFVSLHGCIHTFFMHFYLSLLIQSVTDYHIFVVFCLFNWFLFISSTFHAVEIMENFNNEKIVFVLFYSLSLFFFFL